MHYTEKEQKGINKVEKMNRLFDKALMPAIGVLIIITLLSFIVGRFMDKFGGGNERKPVSAVSNASEIFDVRNTLLQNYEQLSEGFSAYGYTPAEGYSQRLALRKVVDEELTVYQFMDDSMGCFTILRYTPLVQKKNGYQSLSMTVSSSKLLNVTANVGDEKYTVAFTSTDFSSYAENEDAAYRKMMKVVSTDELTALYELFEADIRNLAEATGSPASVG